MAKYTVGCTIIYNGYAEVEASSSEEANEIVLDSWDNDLNINIPENLKLGLADFYFGEATVDYADITE